MTAELAVGLAGVLLVLAALLSAGQVVLAQVRAADAAAAAARAAARGEASAALAAAVERVAGGDAATSSAVAGSQVVVEVQVPIRLLLPGRPRLQVRGRAVADVEGATATGPTGVAPGPAGG